MVDAIRQRGGTAQHLLFEDEGHGVVKLQNRICAYTAIGDALERHLALMVEALFNATIKAVHRRLNTIFNEQFDCIRSPLNNLLHCNLICTIKLTQHIINLAATWGANSHSQARKFFRGELANYRLHAIMSTITTFPPYSSHPQIKVKIVIDNA